MKKISGVIHVQAKMAPVVELDSEAHAAYIRLSRNRVAHTELIDDRGCIVTIDLDRNGNAVGVELVGVNQFNIGSLLKKANVALAKKDIQRANYVPAALERAA